MIRGMIMGVLGLCSSLGVIVYLQLVRWMIPDPCPYNWVFGFVAALDAIMLVFCMIMIGLGKFGGTAPHEDEALDGLPKSDKNIEGSHGSMDDDSCGGFPMGEIHECDSNDEATEAPESLRFNSVTDDDLLNSNRAGIVAESKRRKESLAALATSEDPLNMESARNSRDRVPNYAKIEEDIDGENKMSVLVPGD
jgi:hypothetical protein